MKTSNCRFCQTELEVVFIDLYHSPPSNSYLNSRDLTQPEIYFPLKVYICHHCLLVQLPEYEKAEQIFDEDYAYFSSYSTSWLAHCEKYKNEIIPYLDLKPETSFICELASNDGYLLQYFKNDGFKVLGIEPTLSTAKVARKKGIETITEFFGERLGTQVSSDYGKPDLVIANNVVAHVPDINDFIVGIKKALASTGTITFEFPHLLQLMSNQQFDTIYHEHFSYFSLSTLKVILESHGLEVYHVEEIPTHGGSLRVYATHTGSRDEEVSVNELILKEVNFGLNNIEYYKSFHEKCISIKTAFVDFLVQKKKSGKKIAAYGAAAKGNTLLNYCGIKSDQISFVVDANPVKQNKYLPGSHIPIVDESKLKDYQPDYIVIFPWNIKDEITEQLEYCKDWGAKFVTVIPQLEVF